MSGADAYIRERVQAQPGRIEQETKRLANIREVICLVLGEYGTADGKYSASYITGKLCDVAEGHSSDDTVKAYTVTALMKIYSFEIAAGRQVDMLPEVLFGSLDLRGACSWIFLRSSQIFLDSCAYVLCDLTFSNNFTQVEGNVLSAPRVHPCGQYREIAQVIDVIVNSSASTIFDERYPWTLL